MQKIENIDEKMKNIFKTTFMAIILSLFITIMAQAAPAQNITLSTLEGVKVSLNDFQGKVVVVAVGATWLPLSRQQAVIVNKLAKTYTEKEVIILWVSTDSLSEKSKNYASNDQIRGFGTKNKLTVQILRDPDSLFVKNYGLDQLPAFVILDKKGKISGKPIGGIDPDNDLTIQINERINGLL